MQSAVQSEDNADGDEEDEELEEKSKRKRGRGSKKGGRKSGTPASNTKVPTLKIKLGKRKQNSSVSSPLSSIEIRKLKGLHKVNCQCWFQRNHHIMLPKSYLEISD